MTDESFTWQHTWEALLIALRMHVEVCCSCEGCSAKPVTWVIIPCASGKADDSPVLGFCSGHLLVAADMMRDIWEMEAEGLQDGELDT